ncbi:hypothetical protein EVAR_75071_1 [Eumeta japonica]|uniref:Uncharacterized protein n=1 Tax=Eumeta variegata TaxID=151549 RepID=A0A4C1W353_EUMVA|nr:hypothetical protein EVAR_75071_1 [Eumeta japonica]
MKRSAWVQLQGGGRLGCNGEIFWSECNECDCNDCNPNYVCVCSDKVFRNIYSLIAPVVLKFYVIRERAGATDFARAEKKRLAAQFAHQHARAACSRTLVTTDCISIGFELNFLQESFRVLIKSYAIHSFYGSVAKDKKERL